MYLLFLYFNGSENFIANNELIGVTERAIKCDNIYIMLPLCTLLCGRHCHSYCVTGTNDDFVIVAAIIIVVAGIRHHRHHPHLFCPWIEIFHRKEVCLQAFVVVQ